MLCKPQESSLALLWTVGIFSLNFGPVLMGFVLDYLGPKFTGILGAQMHACSKPVVTRSKSLVTDASNISPSCCCLLPPAGVVLNMLGLVLFAVSSSSGVNAFAAAAVVLGLGNITFHLAQFHISALFPRSRGLVSSVFVAGFTGSGIIMYLLLLIFQAAGSTP